MRTDIVIDSIQKNNGFSSNTWFLIQADKNPEITSFYFNKGIYGLKIFINEVALNEVEHNRFDKTEILLKMKEIFGQIIIIDVTKEEQIIGQNLEKMCSVLNSVDSTILAFAKSTSASLVTLHENPAKSCKFFSVNCILFQIIQQHGGNSNVF